MALDTIRCGDLRPAPGHLEIIYSAVLTLILVATVSSNVYVFVRLVKVPSKWTSCKKIAQYLLCMGSFEAVLSTSVTSTTTVAGKIIVNLAEDLPRQRVKGQRELTFHLTVFQEWQQPFDTEDYIKLRLNK